MKRPIRTTILKETEEVRLRLCDIDLRQIQGRFSALFDRAARGVLDMGHDLDEVEMVRRFHCSGADGRTTRVAADPLSNRFRLIDAVRAAHETQMPDEIFVTALEVEAVLEIQQ